MATTNTSTLTTNTSARSARSLTERAGICLAGADASGTHAEAARMAVEASAKRLALASLGGTAVDRALHSVEQALKNVEDIWTEDQAAISRGIYQKLGPYFRGDRKKHERKKKGDTASRLKLKLKRKREAEEQVALLAEMVDENTTLKETNAELQGTNAELKLRLAKGMKAAGQPTRLAITLEEDPQRLTRQAARTLRRSLPSGKALEGEVSRLLRLRKKIAARLGAKQTAFKEAEAEVAEYPPNESPPGTVEAVGLAEEAVSDAIAEMEVVEQRLSLLQPLAAMQKL